MGIKAARKYTQEQRRAATEDARQLGAAAASRMLGIPEGTLASWLHLEKRAAASDTARAPRAGVIETKPSVVASESQGPVPQPPRPPVAGVSEIEPSAVAGGSQGREAALPAPVAGEPQGSEPVRPAPVAGGPQGLEPAPRPKRRPYVAKFYTPSQRAEILEYAAQHGPTAASKKFKVTRFSIGVWQRKVAAAAAGGTAPAPTTGPDTNPADEREARILKVWRAHPGLGPSQVRNQLRRAGFKVSVHSCRVVMEKHGYVTPLVRRERTGDNYYEATRPNALWHLDFLHRHIHKQPVYVLLLVDDYSRFITGAALWDGERVGAVIETFETAITQYGRPEKAMSDGGSAFYAWRGLGQFTRLLEELEVDQLIATRPQTNGKLENLNANIQKELFNVEKFFDLGEAQRRLRAWVSFFNFRRTHHALGGLLVPADRYFGRADEVLAQIEAGHSVDGSEEPVPVGERLLDLFRVTSRAGQLEIWLMGQRLLVVPSTN